MTKLIKTLCLTFAAVCALTACEKTPEQIAQEQAKAKEHATMLATLVKLSTDECQTAPTAQLKENLADLSNKDLRILANNKVTICVDTRLDAQKGFGKNIYAIYYNDTAKKVVSINTDKKGDIDYGYTILSRLPEVVLTKKDGENYYAGRFSSGKTRVTRWRSEDRFDSTLSSNPQLKTPPLKPSAATQW